MNLCGGSGGDGSGNGVRVSGVSDMGIRVSGVSVACIVGGSVPGVGNLKQEMKKKTMVKNLIYILILCLDFLIITKGDLFSESAIRFSNFQIS